MDIFTTYLTRVVPVPIKPANLKVKALLKESSISNLKEDTDHLENHSHYFVVKTVKKDGDQSSEEEMDRKETETSEVTQDKLTDIEKTSVVEEEAKKKADGITQTNDGIKHLDLYV